MKPTKSLLTVVSILTLAGASLLGAGVAAASPSPTPNDLTGAQNMITDAAWGLGYGGMPHSMSVNNWNGDLGMCHAVWLAIGTNPCDPQS